MEQGMYGYRELVVIDRVPFFRWCSLVLIMFLNGWGVLDAQAASAQLPCATGAVVETEGYHRLALIVGVGAYKSSKIKPLTGPPGDAQRIYELLTGQGGYGFPKSNVCLLLDNNATVSSFKMAFKQYLTERAKPNDVVVIYFAGHGSITKDLNGDEGDGNDETLVFYDSRTNGVHDLIDDEFNEMLVSLHNKTSQITVILDSCNSGTAVRGDILTLTPRYQEPEIVSAGGSTVSQPSKSEGSPTFISRDLSGLVLLSAAGDGTSAMETGGRGIFTDALLTVFSQAPKPPMT